MGPGPVREGPALNASAESPSKPPPRRRRRWKRWVVPLAVLAALWLARVPLLTAAGRWLDASDPPALVDCVMVLGGDHDYRPMAAAALYKAGLAHRVLVPSFRQRADARAEGYPPEQEVIRRVLEARGVPAQNVQTLEGDVDSTADEAASLGRYLDDHPGLTVAVVTTDYHTRRSRWTFERRCAGKGAALRFVSAPAHGFDASDWWRSERGFTAYLDEYAKLAVYWLRG